jgi:hypothetical protein
MLHCFLRESLKIVVCLRRPVWAIYVVNNPILFLGKLKLVGVKVFDYPLSYMLFKRFQTLFGK